MSKFRSLLILPSQSRQSSKNLISPPDSTVPLFSSKFRTLHNITHALSDQIPASCSTRQGGASRVERLRPPYKYPHSDPYSAFLTPLVLAPRPPNLPLPRAPSPPFPPPVPPFPNERFRPAAHWRVHLYHRAPSGSVASAQAAPYPHCL